MSALSALVRTDLALFFQNRRAVIMSMAAPILIAAFFGYLFSNNRPAGPTRIPIGVVDLDQSAVTHQIVAALGADNALEVSQPSEEAGLALVKAGKLRALITVPKGFGTQAAGALFGVAAKPEVELRYDPSQAIALQVIRGLLAQHVMENVVQSTFSAGSDVIARGREAITSNKDVPDGLRTDLLSMFDSVDRVTQRNAAGGSGAGGPKLSVPYSLHEEQASARPQIQYNSFAHSFAGMSVQFIMLMGIDLGVGLLLMRRMGLWQRLRAAPLSKSLLVGSRIASGALIGIIVLAVVYTAAIAVFGVRIEGSLLGFVAMLVSLALLATTFGLLIAAIGRTPEATRGLAILVTLLLVMLSGAWVPSFLFPEWLQQVSLFVPTRWAVDGLDAVTWRGLDLQAALLPIAVTLGSAVVFAAIAVHQLSWEE